MGQTKEWVINYLVHHRTTDDPVELQKIREHYNKVFEEYDTDEKFIEKFTSDWYNIGYQEGLQSGYKKGFVEGSGGNDEITDSQRLSVFFKVERYWGSLGHDDGFVDFLFEFLNVYREGNSQHEKMVLETLLNSTR